MKETDGPSYEPPSQAQREVLTEACTAYATSLSDETYDYLENRGLDLETITEYQLGEVVEPFPGHEHLAGWLCIPYLDKDGVPLKLRFRRLDGMGEPKYMDLSGALPRLYNVGAIHRAVNQGDTIHLTEGELDALILEQLGMPAVAVPGAQAWRPHHRRMLSGFNVVHIWSDPDKAGHELAATVTQSMRQAKVVRLVDGDVGESFLLHGADYLRELVA